MMPHDHFIAIVAQSPAPGPRADNPQAQVLVLVGVFIVLVIGGFLLVMWLRRRTLGGSGADDQTATLMESLRAMRARGEITEEEFEATRKAMRSRLAASLDAPKAARPVQGRGNASG